MHTMEFLLSSIHYLFYMVILIYSLPFDWTKLNVNFRYSFYLWFIVVHLFKQYIMFACEIEWTNSGVETRRGKRNGLNHFRNLYIFVQYV